MSSAIHRQNIYIYSGPGANPICVEHTKRSLERHLEPHSYNVISSGIDHSYLRLKNWERDCAAVVFPGGHSLTCNAALNHDENGYSISKSDINTAQKVKGFVNNHEGAFLGICAGGFVASRSIDMYEGKIIGTPYLQLASCKAVGFPYFPTTWDSHSYKTIKAAPIEVDLDTAEAIGVNRLHIFWNGGPQFTYTEFDARLIGSYLDADVHRPFGALPPAIVKSFDTRGKVILSGVHFELEIEEFLSESEKKQLGPLLEKITTDREPREKLSRYIYQELGLTVKKITSDKIIDKSLSEFCY